jgi:hypothetical protein
VAGQLRSVAVSANGNRIVAEVNNGSMYTSTSNRTTTGTAGFVIGGRTNELQLRYLGDGLFDTISANVPLSGLTVNQANVRGRLATDPREHRLTSVFD